MLITEHIWDKHIRYDIEHQGSKSSIIFTDISNNLPDIMVYFYEPPVWYGHINVWEADTTDQNIDYTEIIRKFIIRHNPQRLLLNRDMNFNLVRLLQTTPMAVSDDDSQVTSVVLKPREHIVEETQKNKHLYRELAELIYDQPNKQQLRLSRNAVMRLKNSTSVIELSWAIERNDIATVREILTKNGISL